VRILFDTSALVAVLIQTHPAHVRVMSWLRRAEIDNSPRLIAAHSLAELYSILTTYPIRPRISPAAAQQMIEQSILSTFEIVQLSGVDYTTVIAYLARQGITGGATYDALILSAAVKAGADQIVTLNERHFRRIRPDLAENIIAP
jgi:predicted nucleic acid-binding protein